MHIRKLREMDQIMNFLKVHNKIAYNFAEATLNITLFNLRKIKKIAMRMR